MTVQAGTIVAVDHPQRNFTGIAPTVQTAVINVHFYDAYTASDDTFSIADVGATIESFTKRGKTNTILEAMCMYPGMNSAGTAVYSGPLTVSTDALTGSLCNVSDSEINVPGGTTVPVQILVRYSEA